LNLDFAQKFHERFDKAEREREKSGNFNVPPFVQVLEG
jgi:hypothetical protein